MNEKTQLYRISPIAFIDIRNSREDCRILKALIMIRDSLTIIL